MSKAKALSAKQIEGLQNAARTAGLDWDMLIRVELGSVDAKITEDHVDLLETAIERRGQMVKEHNDRIRELEEKR